MELPILIFDERVLSPRFGYVFQRRWLQPYESVVGMLWKFARMNGLPGHSLVPHLCRRPVDPYEGIDPADVDVRLLAQLLAIAQKSVRAGIGRASADASPHLRYCPRCIDVGFHGRPHQQLRHARCPIHGWPLQTRCCRCGRESVYRLDAQMLDAPFRCRHCRRHYTPSGSAPAMRHFALPTKERAAITRAALC